MSRRKGSAATCEAAQNPRRPVLENISKQAKKSKEAKWIYTESNRNKDKI